VDLPNQPEDDFDKDITGTQPSDSIDFDALNIVFSFGMMKEQFDAMTDAGFTEAQALRFLAFCSIYDGDF